MTQTQPRDHRIGETAVSRRDWLEWVIQNGAIVAVLFLVGPPVLMLIYGSFRTDRPGGRGEFTLGNYAEILTDPRYVTATRNSLVIATVVALCCMALGTGLAWLVRRTDMPAKRLATVFITASFFFPSFISAMAWAMLASPRSGILSTLAPMLKLNIYSVTGIVWVLVLSYVPYSFLFAAAPISSIDPALEEAARLSGASEWKVFLTVTVPLVKYSVLSAGLLIFVSTLSVFGVPAILGTPARVWVLATRIWELTRFTPTDMPAA